MSLVIHRVGICITLHNCCLQLALFQYQRPALGMTFQPIPMNLIYRYSDNRPHSSECPNPPTNLSSHAALHAHPYIILNPSHPQPPHKHRTWPRAPTLSKTSAAPLTHIIPPPRILKSAANLAVFGMELCNLCKCCA